MKKLTCEPYLLPNLSRQLSKIRQDPIATSALADTAAPELESSWTRSTIVPLHSMLGQPCPSVPIPPLKQEPVSSCKLAVLRKGPKLGPFQPVPRIKSSFSSGQCRGSLPLCWK